MGPHWYQMFDEMCEEDHNPDDYEGREWDELTDDEKHEAINSRVTDFADSIE